MLLALAVCASIVLTPALVRRLGEQPRGQRQRAIETLDFVSVAISSERLDMADAISAALGDCPVTLHHIGSTSVPGLPARDETVREVGA